MNPYSRVRLFAIIASMPVFAACGGGGTGESPSTPPQTESPTPTPAPAPAVAVTIFSSPVPQVYASLGSSSMSAGDGYTPVAPDARLTDVSLEAMDQPLLRYTASGGYEIQLPGAEFDKLVHYAGLQNPTAENNFFQPWSARQNFATFIISRSSLEGYRHSELASWTDATAVVRAGTLAFGTPTPSAAMPASGTATYRGRISGMVDILHFDALYGGDYFTGVTGTVTLTVNFVERKIAGTLSISVDGGTGAHSAPLSATTILSGEDTFWGLFETSQSGFNEFKVRLTGPDAGELIGSWAIPLLIDGEPHQLMGAWIAARES